MQRWVWTWLGKIRPSKAVKLIPLRWRHNERDSVSTPQPRDCLLSRLFRRRSKKTSKLRVTGLCVGTSPGLVNSPHKGPVTRKMFSFDDVIMPDFSWRLLIGMMTWSCGNIFRVSGRLWGESTGQPSPVDFPSQKPATRSFDIFIDLCLNNRLAKQSRRQWFETPLHLLWRHCNGCKLISSLRNMVLPILWYISSQSSCYWWPGVYSTPGHLHAYKVSYYVGLIFR